MVNNYLKNMTGHEFTAKDFRTWAGTVHAVSAFCELIRGDAHTHAASDKEIKSTTTEVVVRVASHLGNTATVCKKYYIHPAILTLYETNKLDSYVKRFYKKSAHSGLLSRKEQLLMTILEKERLAHI